MSQAEHVIPRPPQAHAADARRRSGFTLIELIVVIAIIGILAAISLVVARKVIQGGKVKLTEDTLRVLDALAASYSQQREGQIPKTIKDQSAAGNEFPIIDARLSTNTDLSAPPEPSTALFILLASDLTGGEAALKGLDSKLIKRAQIQSAVYSGSPFQTKLGTQAASAIDQIAVIDPWGNPIRLVLPAYHGGYGDATFTGPDGMAVNVMRAVFTPRPLAGASTAVQFRRSIHPKIPGIGPGDADEGLCAGTQPYFYSAGPDQDPGVREDNIYTHKPTFPPETAQAP